MNMFIYVFTYIVLKKKYRFPRSWFLPDLFMNPYSCFYAYAESKILWLFRYDLPTNLVGTDHL